MAKINSLIINIFIWASVFLTVQGDDYSWIPSKTLTPAHQCMQKPQCFVGQCRIPATLLWTICGSLPCAKLVGDVYIPVPTTPHDGTICGESRVCRNGFCVHIPASKRPKERGSKAVYDCNWDLNTTVEFSNNQSSSVGL